MLGALSHALDMVEGQPAGHCVRCCWIGIDIGREIGLSEPEIWELYYTLLLKDLGCSSNAARICQLYLTDDMSFKHDAKLIDGSLPQALRFVLAHTGLKAGLAERFRALIVAFSRTAGTIAQGADRNALSPRRGDRAKNAVFRSCRARHPKSG